MDGPWNVARVTADGLIFQGPVVYHGGTLRATGGGAATVDVYDGTSTLDALRDAFSAAASAIDPNAFDAGLRFERGLFIDLGANVDLFVVYWSLPESPSP